MVNDDEKHQNEDKDNGNEDLSSPSSSSSSSSQESSSISSSNVNSKSKDITIEERDTFTMNNNNNNSNNKKKKNGNNNDNNPSSSFKEYNPDVSTTTTTTTTTTRPSSMMIDDEDDDDEDDDDDDQDEEEKEKDEDQSCSSELHNELQKIGMSSTFVVHHQDDNDNNNDDEMDVDSLGNGSYIVDLMEQRSERETLQREEIMEIALERYNNIPASPTMNSNKEKKRNVLFIKLIKEVQNERKDIIQKQNKIQDERIAMELVLRSEQQRQNQQQQNQKEQQQQQQVPNDDNAVVENVVDDDDNNNNNNNNDDDDEAEIKNVDDDDDDDKNDDDAENDNDDGDVVDDDNDNEEEEILLGDDEGKLEEPLKLVRRDRGRSRGRSRGRGRGRGRRRNDSSNDNNNITKSASTTTTTDNNNNNSSLMEASHHSNLSIDWNSINGGRSPNEGGTKRNNNNNNNNNSTDTFDSSAFFNDLSWNDDSVDSFAYDDDDEEEEEGKKILLRQKQQETKERLANACTSIDSILGNLDTNNTTNDTTANVDTNSIPAWKKKNTPTTVVDNVGDDDCDSEINDSDSHSHTGSSSSLAEIPHDNNNSSNNNNNNNAQEHEYDEDVDKNGRRKNEDYSAIISQKHPSHIEEGSSAVNFVKPSCVTNFWGREEELQMLQTGFLTATSNNDVDNTIIDDDNLEDDMNIKPRHVWISGVAGIGKTRCIDTFLRQDFPRQPFICRGSFEDNWMDTSNPYQGIISCFTDLFESLLEESKDIGKWRERIQYCLGDDDITMTLVLLIPTLAILLEVESDETDYSFDKTDKFLFERLSNALGRILKSICDYSSVIFFLDDLHWAGDDSLRLLTTILLTKNLKNFFFVGSHRVVKVSRSLPKIKLKLSALFGADMKLGGIDAQSAISLVLNHLNRLHNKRSSKIDTDDTLVPFFDSWYSHPSGSNPFFLVQLVHLLYEQKNIKFKAGRWKLDSNVVIPSTSLDLVAKRLDELPKEHDVVLQSAALLDVANFQIDALLVAITTLSQSQKMETETEKVKNSLRILSKKMMIEECPNGRYMFAHDVLRRATSSRIPAVTKRRRSRLHFRLATNLKKLEGRNKYDSESQATDNANILIADHLKKGISSIENNNKIEMFAILYLELAETSMKRGSFVTASQLLETGMGALDKKSKWVDSYEVTLRIHLAFARCLYCSNDYDKVKSLSNAIIANGNSPRDTIGAFEILISMYRSKKQHEEAKQCTLKALLDIWDDDISTADVEEKFSKVRKLVQNMSDADLLVLSDMEHKKTTKKMPFLLQLAEISGLCKNYKLQDLAALRMLELTLKYGSYEINFTGLVFALCGLSVARRRLHGEACRYGRLADMMSDIDSPLGRQAIAHYHYSMRHWRSSIRENRESLIDACWASMDANELENLSFQVGVYISTIFFSGLPFDCEDKILEKYIEKRRQRNILDECWNVTAPYNAVMRLKGETSRLIKKKYSDPKAIQYDIFFQMVTSMFMGDIDSAVKFNAKIFIKPGGFWGSYRAFMEGLISTHHAQRSSGKEKFFHQNQATKFIDILTTWTRKGLNSCAHMANILKVELTIASGKGATEKRSSFLIDTAISSASQDGFLHHAALASERAGLYFLFLEDETGASKFLSRACILYEEWGAGAKVKQLVSRYEKYLNAHPEPFESLYRSNSNHSGSLMFTDSSHGPASNPRRRSHICQPKNGPIESLSNNSYHGPPSNSSQRQLRDGPRTSQQRRKSLSGFSSEKSKRDELGSQSEHPRSRSLMRIESWAKRRSASKEKSPKRVMKKRMSLKRDELGSQSEHPRSRSLMRIESWTKRRSASKEKSPKRVTKKRMSLKRDELGSQSEHPRRPSLMRIESWTKRRSASKEKYEAQGREELRTTPKTPRRKLKNVISRPSPSGERNIRSRHTIAKKPSPETMRRKSLLSTPKKKKKKNVPLVKTDDWDEKYDIDEFNSRKSLLSTPKKKKKNVPLVKIDDWDEKYDIYEFNSSKSLLSTPKKKKKKKNVPLVKDWVEKYGVDEFNSRKSLLSTPKKKKKKKNVPLVKIDDWVEKYDIDEFSSSDDDDDSTAEENAGKSKQTNRGTPKGAKKKSLENKNNTKLEESPKSKRSTQKKKKKKKIPK